MKIEEIVNELNAASFFNNQEFLGYTFCAFTADCCYRKFHGTNFYLFTSLLAQLDKIMRESTCYCEDFNICQNIETFIHAIHLIAESDGKEMN